VRPSDVGRGAVGVGALTAAAVTVGLPLARRLIGPTSPWIRRNFRDREVTLLLGPVVSAATAAGLVASGRRTRRGTMGFLVSSALVGMYDDLYGSRRARGLRGHARALRDGQLTTGVIKLVVMTAAAAVGSVREQPTLVDAALGTVLVAGSANLVNLFDVRPGRAAKVSTVAAAMIGVGQGREARAVAAVAAGAALAALPADLGERDMLGDAGAGVLGALLGASMALSGSRRRRGALAAAVVGLTAVSERVSFSAVIDAVPPLRALDRLGRRSA
jgi:UDP-GlcNAc:undecaprenyl-phosphate/decaprenyl-phosphate GlcNAc-1-phosphate transferase